MPGLPDELIEVSIEPIERAVAYLRQRGFDRVGIYGISKGGELALLAASLMPQITCVVAISPLACAMPGITGNKSLAGKGLSDRSSWTWRGEPVPCARGGGRLPYLGIIRRIVTERQLDMRFVYERIVERAPKEAWIAVERINGNFRQTSCLGSLIPSFTRNDLVSGPLFPNEKGLKDAVLLY